MGGLFDVVPTDPRWFIQLVIRDSFPVHISHEFFFSSETERNGHMSALAFSDSLRDVVAGVERDLR